MAAKPTEIISVKLRMREGLRRVLSAEAKKTKRSINQEMVRRLERSFLADDMKEAIQIAAETAAKMSVEAVLRTLIKRQTESEKIETEPTETDELGSLQSADEVIALVRRELGDKKANALEAQFRQPPVVRDTEKDTDQ